VIFTPTFYYSIKYFISNRSIFLFFQKLIYPYTQRKIGIVDKLQKAYFHLGAGVNHNMSKFEMLKQLEYLIAFQVNCLNEGNWDDFDRTQDRIKSLEDQILGPFIHENNHYLNY
jgi:hypothetical protein